MLVGIPYYPSHAAQRRQVIGLSLGIATGNYDLGRRIVAVDTADRLARVAIRFRSHRAGVYDDHVGHRCVAGPLESAPS